MPQLLTAMTIVLLRSVTSFRVVGPAFQSQEQAKRCLMSSGMRLFSGQRSPGNSKDSQLRKEGERDTIINDADSLSPRQRRLAKNKMVSQSRKRGAPGRVSGNIGATPKLPDGFDPSHPGDISDPRVFLEAISAYEEVGASRKILAVCDAAAEAGSRHGDGESHADTVPEALLRASVAAELRLGRPDLARDLVFKWGVGSLAPLAAAAQNGESYDRRIGAVASALPYQLQCDGDTGSTSALAPLSSASQELYKFIKALCQNGVVDAAAHVVQKLDLLSTTSERTKQRLDSEQSATLWLGMLPLVHASLARGYMKQSDWVLARQALRRWHRDAQKEEREMEGRTEAEEDSKRQHSMGVSIDVANSLLRTAAKGKDLPTLLETLETVGAIGCPANDETFEIVANAAVQSVEFVTGAVSIDTLPPMTIAGEGGGQGASSVPMPEVAFVGRSNVGKSSLVNMVCNRRAMAYTSKTPGKTQQFNYFAINSKSRWQPRGAFYLVDLPGVGYAKVPKAQRQKWLDFMRQYLYERPTLKVVFHLVDSRHGPVDQDIQLMELMARRDPAKHPVTYVVVLTKADKRSSQLRGTLEKINAALEESGCDAATTPVLLTSANSRLGRDHMWRYLRIAADPGFFEQ